MKNNQLTLLASCTLFCLFFLPVLVFSQLPDNWTKLPGGTLKTLHDVAALSTDTLFTIDEDGDIFSTFDGGNTWKERNPQTGKEIKINALRANPNRQTIIAIGEDGDIYRYTGKSGHWGDPHELESDASGSSSRVSLYAITDDGDNYDPSIVYVVGAKGTILKSTNDGADWEKKELNIGANQDLKFVSFLNVDTGFVANENGIIRTFDGGNSWKVVSTETGIRALKARGKFKAGKALADVVKSIGSNGGGIQTSTDYGATWTKDAIENPCDLLATGGTIFDPSQCEDLHQGLLVIGGGGGAGKANFNYMLAGNTFKGILQPKWENVDLEGILMVMRTVDDQTLIVETVTDNKGRFDLDIPSSFSGDVEIVSMQAWDIDWCPKPLPPDETILEPMEECDESTLNLRIISAEQVDLNDLVFYDNEWIAVGNKGVILSSTDDDSDEDGLADTELWSKQNSRTTEDLFAATARGIEKSDIRRGFIAAGSAGRIIATQSPGFEIISPNRNDAVCAGSEITINWSGGNQNWNVLISIIDVNAWTVAAVINPSTINDGNETWNIPSNFPAGIYQIYVQEVNYATWTYGEIFTIKHCPADPVCLEECANNLLRNWNFNENPIFGPMPQGSVSDWTRWPSNKSPDVSSIKCSNNDTVSIGMWGNGINGESIFQTLTTPFQPGQTYSISFLAMWRDIPGRPYPLQYEFRANNANLSSYEIIGVSSPILTKENWVLMSLPDWEYTGSVDGPYSVISVRPINHSFSAHYDSTSYGLITAICITEARTTGISYIQPNTSGFKLGQSYPNPSSQSVVIQYTVPHNERVLIKVYNMNGTEVKILVNDMKTAGEHQVEWNATGLPSGIYFYQMRAGSFIKTKKMELNK